MINMTDCEYYLQINPPEILSGVSFPITDMVKYETEFNNIEFKFRNFNYHQINIIITYDERLEELFPEFFKD